MKKSLLALAVAAALPAVAHAQSSVTMYGLLDASVEWSDEDTNLAISGPGSKSTIRMNNGRQAGSRFGVRGVEDLGGGLKAIFAIEHRFNVDTGAQSLASSFWNGQAFVGLQGGWGELTLGRQYNPIFYVILAADLSGNWWYNNWAAFADTGGTLGAQRADGVQGAVRHDNAIIYKSPAFGGLTLRAMYALGESTNPNAATSTGNDTVGLGAEFRMGSLYLGAGYHKTNDVNVTAGAGAREDYTAVAASWKTNTWGVSLGFAEIGYSGTGKIQNILGSAMVKVGSGDLVLSLIDADYEGFPGFKNGSGLAYGLTYNMPMSKRTNWYVTLGGADLSPVQATGTTDLDSMRVSVGIRHLF